MIWAFSLLTTDLITRSLTAGLYLVYGIRSLIGDSVSRNGPLSPFSALPPLDSISDASPKAISEENQLSPSSIGISPLSTSSSHALFNVPTWFESST